MKYLWARWVPSVTAINDDIDASTETGVKYSYSFMF